MPPKLHKQLYDQSHYKIFQELIWLSKIVSWKSFELYLQECLNGFVLRQSCCYGLILELFYDKLDQIVDDT